MAGNSEQHRSFFRYSHLLYLSGVILLVAIVYQITHPVQPIDFGIAPEKMNNRLEKLDKLNVSPYTGCESIVLDNGCIYTGSSDGKILKLDTSGVSIFADLNEKDCVPNLDCSRPLGMRLSHDGQSLLFVDAYRGLFKIPLSTGVPVKLFPLDSEFRVTFFDDLDVLPNGTVIISEASTKYGLSDLLKIVFEQEPSGRILSVDPDTGKWHEILNHLHFPNGIQLHSDGLSVLIAETSVSRIIRLPLDGGSPSIFAENLIGIPDNIRASPRGGYWVPVSNLKTSPIQKILELPHYFPFLRWLIPELSKYRWFHNLRLTKSAMLLRLDEDGKLIEALSDPTKSVTNVAEVREHNGFLYTGSYYLPYIGRLPVD